MSYVYQEKTLPHLLDNTTVTELLHTVTDTLSVPELVILTTMTLLVVSIVTSRCRTHTS